MVSIDWLSTDNADDDISISINTLEDIRYGSQIHQKIKVIGARLNNCERMKQTQNEQKGAEIPEKSTGKGLHKVYKDVVNELNNAFPNLEESDSGV